MLRRKILCILGMITVPVPAPGGASQASHACVPTPRALAGESNCLWFKRFELGDLVSVLNLGALYHDLFRHPRHLLGYCLSCRSWNWQIVRENWTPTIAKILWPISYIRVLCEKRILQIPCFCYAKRLLNVFESDQNLPWKINKTGKQLTDEWAVYQSKTLHKKL